MTGILIAAGIIVLLAVAFVIDRRSRAKHRPNGGRDARQRALDTTPHASRTDEAHTAQMYLARQPTSFGGGGSVG